MVIWVFFLLSMMVQLQQYLPKLLSLGVIYIQGIGLNLLRRIPFYITTGDSEVTKVQKHTGATVICSIRLCARKICFLFGVFIPTMVVAGEMHDIHIITISLTTTLIFYTLLACVGV